MPNVSYQFTIPHDKYDDFKNDIEAIAKKLDLEKDVEFDHDSKTALFNCDSRALYLLFEPKSVI